MCVVYGRFFFLEIYLILILLLWVRYDLLFGEGEKEKLK